MTITYQGIMLVWLVVYWVAALTTIFMIGKERKPYGPGSAVFSVGLAMFLTILYLTAD